MNLIAPETLGGDQMRNDHAVFISRSLRLGQQTPVSNPLSPLVETQNDISVADVDCQKHLLANSFFYRNHVTGDDPVRFSLVVLYDECPFLIDPFGRPHHNLIGHFGSNPFSA